MLKFSFRNGQGLDFTMETSRENELADMHNVLEKEGFIPEDVPSLV
jgi:hypothetical protein